MDFIRVLRSLEELIYEAMTWLLFYPRTLWRSAVSPLRMLRYAEDELADSAEQQFTDTLSPVLFLMITLALTHALNQAIGSGDAEFRGLMRQLMSSEQNQLLTRTIAFAIFPLVYSIQQLRRSSQPIDRNSLRAPFYGQCFVAGVFALVLGVSSTMVRMNPDWARLLGTALTVGSVVWYVAVQAGWSRERYGAHPMGALGLALLGFIEASAVVVLAVVVLSLMS